MTTTDNLRLVVAKRKSILFVCITAALGGLLFGYDTAVISGAISFLKQQYSLSAVQEGWLVSSGLLGCICGVIITGAVSDLWGRKKVLFLAAFLFSLSAIGCSFAWNYNILVVARMVGGVGVGVASVISPLYIAEFSPAKIRGRLIALYQLAITIGILLSYFSNALIINLKMFSDLSPALNKILIDEPWRGMFFVMAIPAVIFLVLLIWLPESPRWLLMVNRPDEARVIVESYDISLQAVAKRTKLKAGLLRNYRLPLLVGIVLAVLQQFCGINAIIYYGPSIFESAGILKSNALLFQVIIGVINLLFTMVAMASSDKFGRRPLMILGLGGIIVSLASCAFLSSGIYNNGTLLLVSIVIFIACFALSLGPVTWMLINEIFPSEIRVKAVSICTFALWVAVFLVGQFFPWLLEHAGAVAVFATFAFFGIVNLFFTIFVVKETKNTSLEDAADLFVSPH